MRSGLAASQWLGEPYCLKMLAPTSGQGLPTFTFQQINSFHLVYELGFYLRVLQAMLFCDLVQSNTH